MSVNDEGSYPWLKPEKRFIRAVIDLGVPVVGVCLGAQLIASALDAQVAACRHKEIGWFPINGVDGGGKTFRFPPRVNVFHWHGETFDLPRGAKRIASNAVCANQGFQVGANVIGLQFHLETTPETADLICHHCRDELVDGPYIQSADTISASPESVYSEINNLMDEVLTYVTR